MKTATRMTRIKFCGLTRQEDIDVAIDLRVNAVGFILWPGSPRAISIDDAASLIARLPASIWPVGVFVRPTPEQIEHAVETAGIRAAQVHGMDDVATLCGVSCELWLAVALARKPSTLPNGMTILLDAYDEELYGGTGRTIDWDTAAVIAAQHRVMLAGGLNAENVGDAILRARPYGVDVSSGIEDRPGVKNERLMRAFVAAVREPS